MEQSAAGGATAYSALTIVWPGPEHITCRNQATNQLPEHIYAQRTMKPYINYTLSRYIKWQTLLYNQYNTYFE